MRNILVYKIVHRHHRWFLGNLAIAQFCSSVTYPLVAVSSAYQIWPMGLRLCKIIGFLQGLCSIVAIGTFTALVAKNYSEIICYRSRSIIWLIIARMTNKWNFLKVSLIWVYALALNVPPLFGWGKYEMNGHLTTCCFDFLSKSAENRSFIFYLFWFGFVCPVGLICYYYIILFLEIFRLDNVRRERIRRLNHLLNQPAALNVVGKKIRATKIILLNIVAFLAAWTPFAVVALLGQFSNARLNPAAVTIPAVFAKSSTVYQPIIFGICDPQCKRWFLSYYGKFRRRSISRHEIRIIPVSRMRPKMNGTSTAETTTVF